MGTPSPYFTAGEWGPRVPILPRENGDQVPYIPGKMVKYHIGVKLGVTKATIVW